MTWLMWAWMAMSSAWATTWYVEGPQMDEKSAAASLQDKVDVAGATERVVRRFVPGAGWTYVVVLEGFADEAAARQGGKSAAIAGAVFQVYAVDGADARVIAVEKPAVPVVEAAISPNTSPAKSPEVVLSARPVARSSPETVALLEKVVTVTGGPQAGRSRVQAASSVRFDYRRTIPGGPTALHTYARRGGDVYLSVKVEKGEGVSSETGLVGGVGWLAQSGVTSRENPQRTQEILGRFAPDAILSFPLAIPELGDSADGAVIDGSIVVHGKPCTRVRLGAGAEIAIDPATGFVTRASWRDGATPIHQEFEGWALGADGVAAPTRIRTWRGDVLVDDLEILGLDLDGKLEDRWFATPPEK